jgi:hypothetical protein
MALNYAILGFFLIAFSTLEFFLLEHHNLTKTINTNAPLKQIFTIQIKQTFGNIGHARLGNTKQKKTAQYVLDTTMRRQTQIT